MADAQARVSVVIRNRNETSSLRIVLKALTLQDYPGLEIVLVDNASTDDSLRVAAEFGVRAITLTDFTYGKALNAGFATATGDLIIVLSAHSVPLGPDFIRRAAEAFKDMSVAAARLVYAGKGADMLRWLNPEILEGDGQDYISKGPLASGCVIRRSVWEQIPFDEDAIAAEDKLWSRDVLRSGYKIISPIPAFYYYAKPMSRLAELKKNYREIVAIQHATGSAVGFVSRASISSLVRSLGTATRRFLDEIRLTLMRYWLSLRFPRL